MTKRLTNNKGIFNFEHFQFFLSFAFRRVHCLILSVSVPIHHLLVKHQRSVFPQTNYLLLHFTMNSQDFFAPVILLLMCVYSSNSAVWKSPNSDDQQYWRDYSENYLKKVLETQKVEAVARNVVFFVGDGMSFATIAAGRVLKGQMNHKSGEESEMSFESFPNLGLSKTYNIDKQVPDSAGTATALFTGIKTKLGVICLNPVTRHSKPSDRLKTIIDWAQAANKRTGIVTNTR